ncbi:PEP/pyruvate-binding domain-containing protein [Methanomethylovorans sp.]|uniref:PEP/pyruvate-binding domain-containing protein n=1 Tax=Methanomethylovorans sp. TaxID=2758717 RepID=UPI00351C4F77
MNEVVIPMEDIQEKDRNTIGSKAFSLHAVMSTGLNIPPYSCITTKAYERYLDSGSLQGRIIMELSRKDAADMRWEEMWDTSLRIRNMFLNTPMPEALASEIRKGLDRHLTRVPVVVRSSAPGEDSANTSFAGLHESYVNIKGMDSIIEHIRLVWASLWSDAAFLYRNELGLDIKNSTMAVMVQELVAGEVSGIVFSSNPGNSLQMIVEAVHGLNQGLVDGDVEPDRWIIDRNTGTLIEHVSPSGRERISSLSDTGTVIQRTSGNISVIAPLNESDIHKLREAALLLEKKFGHPQDIEWTKKEGEIYILQSRPITTDTDTEKLWYLSLRRTLDNLQDLRKKIESELIPEMIGDAQAMRSVELRTMDGPELAREIMRRKELYERWKKRYADDLIPFAHGMRMFGRVYNDVLKPSNPYEFMDLLSGSGLLSVKRNEELNRLAGMLRRDDLLMHKARSNAIEGNFRKEVDFFLENFGHTGIYKSEEELLKLIVELASSPKKRTPARKDTGGLQKKFVSAFSQKDRAFAEEVLDIGLVSYRLRDDDNIYLGRIEGQYQASLKEAKQRIAGRIKDFDVEGDVGEEELLKALADSGYVPAKREKITTESPPDREYTRQVRGQPAGEGLVTGVARIITKNEELFNIKFGEILVCDAIDPNMTFVIPLVSAIVERRGGMLIHGAIIAREYGIPCVTGIPGATQLIQNGDEVTVDGYLGIVTIRRSSPR